MNFSHLSNYELEEYLLNERTPRMLHHLMECAACRDSVERSQQMFGMLRTAAVEYSAHSLAARPRQKPFVLRGRRSAISLGWAFAALVPLVLLVLALIPLLPIPSTPQKPAAHAAAISDEALLEQVDEQISVTVPSSMESLTHLVSTGNRAEGTSSLVSPGERSKPSVQSN